MITSHLPVRCPLVEQFGSIYTGPLADLTLDAPLRVKVLLHGFYRRKMAVKSIFYMALLMQMQEVGRRGI